MNNMETGYSDVEKFKVLLAKYKSDLADKVRGMKKNEYDYAIEDEDYVETFNQACDELIKVIEGYII